VASSGSAVVTVIPCCSPLDLVRLWSASSPSTARRHLPLLRPV